MTEAYTAELLNKIYPNSMIKPLTEEELAKLRQNKDLIQKGSILQQERANQAVADSINAEIAQRARERAIANTPQIQATIIPPLPKTEFNPNNFEIIEPPNSSAIVPSSTPIQEATSITPLQNQTQILDLLQQTAQQPQQVRLKQQEQVPELQAFEPNAERSKFINALARGMNNFRNGFVENRYNGYNPSNLTANKFKIGDKEQSKGFMGRLGEAIGTGARKTQGMLKNPVAKGVLSGLAIGLTGGFPMGGLLAGSKIATDSSKSDVYAKALEKYGISVPTGMFDFYNANDFDTLRKPYYDDATLQNSLYKTANDIRSTNADIEYKQGQLQNAKDKNEIEINKNKVDEAYKQAKLANEKEYNKIREKYYSTLSKAKGNTTKSPEYLNEYNKFTQILNNPNAKEEDVHLAIEYLQRNYPDDFSLKDVEALLNNNKKIKELYDNSDEDGLSF